MEACSRPRAAVRRGPACRRTCHPSGAIPLDLLGQPPCSGRLRRRRPPRPRPLRGRPVSRALLTAISAASTDGWTTVAFTPARVFAPTVRVTDLGSGAGAARTRKPLQERPQPALQRWTADPLPVIRRPCGRPRRLPSLARGTQDTARHRCECPPATEMGVPPVYGWSWRVTHPRSSGWPSRRSTVCPASQTTRRLRSCSSSVDLVRNRPSKEPT